MAKKQNISPFLVLLGLAGAGFYAIRKRAAVENLDPALSNFRILEASPLALQTEADFVVTNTQPTTLRISHLVGSIFAGSVRIATYAFPDVRTVPAAGVQPFKLPIRIPTASLLAAGISNITRLLRGEGTTPFRFVGSVKINGISYPYEEVLSLNGNQQG